MIAWVFPGQASQSIGMGSGLDAAAAREVFDTSSAVLGWDVRSVCLHGQEELLNSTEVSQPALLTVSVAAARSLESCGLFPDLVAGHSVGEFAALVVARALSLEDAVRVVKVRADAMAEAGRERPGRMAAVIGLARDGVEEVCAATTGVVNVATVNAPGQVVVSGEVAAVEAASGAMRTAGARRVIPLAVSVAAHSPLMEQAGRAVSRALEGIALLPPLVPFASCVTGQVMDDPSQIRRSLVHALTAPIDWPACVDVLRGEGVASFVEVGPGEVLSGLIRRIVPDAATSHAADDASAIRLATELTGAGLR